MRPFEKRIYYGITIIALALAPLILASFFSIHQLFDQERKLISTSGEQLVKAEQLRSIDSTLSSIMPVYVLSADPRLLADFTRQYKLFDEILAQLMGAENDGSIQALLTHIQTLSLRLRNLAAPGLQLRQEGSSAKDDNDYFRQTTHAFSTEQQVLLKKLVSEKMEKLNAAKAHFAQVMNWVIAGLLFLSCVAISLFVFSGKLIAKAIRQKRAFDETQEQLLKQEQRMSQARKEAVEVVAHDLKNPLGTLKMSIEMMLEEMNQGISAADLKENLEIGYRSVVSMERLIKELLDHAKIEAGQLILEKSEAHLGLLAQDLVERFKPLAIKKKISLSLEVSSVDLAAFCDLGRIEQVLSNLIGNALKFTPSLGSVKVSAGLQENDILISVADTGAGINENQLPHIFDRFWQVKETSHQGNGLGLAIAKAIIEAHQGTIWVESRAQKGSQFSFRLPRLHGKLHQETPSARSKRSFSNEVFSNREQGFPPLPPTQEI